MDARQLLADLTHFPWKSTAVTLRERFREDRLGLTASSLTFTTTMALVPFFTVALAVFTAFPMFSKMQGALQTWLVQSLIPDSIARQVLGYLTQFAGKASRLGTVGLAALVVTAFALVLTIDRTLNSIWRVKRPRPLGQRVLVYWAVMTLGPLLLGACVDPGADPHKTVQVIDPQCHGHAMLIGQLARQAPANADVAEVVDHLAEQGEGNGVVGHVNRCSWLSCGATMIADPTGKKPLFNDV